MNEKQRTDSCSSDFVDSMHVDSMHVDDLSALLTHIQAHEEGEKNEEDAHVDFSVFIEDEDALNVEAISDVFTALEDVTDLLPQLASGDDDNDTDNDSSSSSSSCNDDALAMQSNDDKDNKEDDSSDGQAADDAGCAAADAIDAANVDDVAMLFAMLDESCASDMQKHDDAANVDAIADLFTELADASEQSADDMDVVKKPIHTQDWRTMLLEPARATTVDSRIFVPQFSVRIEGRSRVGVGHSATARSSSQLRAGPPTVYLAGPPQLVATSLSREDRVERWKEKRKVRTFAAREPDAAVSDTRRACAAKRQRVKGRFTREKSAFVPITALQGGSSATVAACASSVSH